MLKTEMDSQFDQKLKFLLKNIHGVIFLIDNDGIFRMSEGMGLSITYSIIKNHGGIVERSSIKGKGATFDIFLPIENSYIVDH